MKDDNSIKFREAKPTIDEGMVFARYLNETAEGFFQSILGEKTFSTIASAYIEPNNEYSFENITFAVKNDIIVGMISGYTTNEKKHLLKNPLNRFSESKSLRIMIFTLIGRILSRFLGPKGEGDFYIQAIIVDKKQRGKGIGKCLMQFIENKALKSQANRLSLDVSSKNDKAKSLYELQRMTVESEWPNLFFIPKIFTRMTKYL